MISDKPILLLVISSLLSLSLFSSFSDHLSISDDTETPTVNASLPVLLIHGYFSNSSVWEKWETLLEDNNIVTKAVNFTNYPDTPENDDECGRAIDHVMELNNIVKDFINDTGEKRINIVGHSKGGLDARVYLANNLSNANIANLIMIGTPNAGSPLAYLNELCSPAILDIRPGSNASNVKMNNNTRYYTIAGDWKPSTLPPDSNCSPRNQTWLFFQKWGYTQLNPPNDGIVPLSSVQLQGSKPLGVSDNCHTDLLGDEEYKMVRKLLSEYRN